MTEVGMAKIKRNPLVQEIRGSAADLVFRQMPDDSAYVSKKQDFSKQWRGEKGSGEGSRCVESIISAI